MVPATDLRDRYFLWMTKGARTIAIHMIACAAAGTNHETLTSLCAIVTSSKVAWLQYTFTDLIYRGSSGLLCDGKFHFCCGTAVCVT